MVNGKVCTDEQAAYAAEVTANPGLTPSAPFDEIFPELAVFDKADAAAKALIAKVSETSEVKS